jgi:ATP-dependent DNA helicase RecG
MKFFEDRVELESPGGFCPPVNERNIYEVRASRNPVLCGALYYMDITRMAREGTRRMRASMQEWQLPDPKFEQETIHGVVVRVTLQNDREMRRRVLDKDVVEHYGIDKWRQLTADEMKVAAYVFRNTTVNVSEAQRVTGRTWKTAKKVLESMSKKGVIDFVRGEYERDPKAHYRTSV